MENTKETIGGVGLSDVIAFQTKIMMGAQFARVMNAKETKDIIIACLRIGWNDAFRHTSKNTDDAESKFKKYKKNHKEEHDEYICGKILSKRSMFDTFLKYAKAKDTESRISIIVEKFDELKKALSDIKIVDGDKPITLGHFQKMFNMALKYYLCLYLCREALGLGDKVFDNEIITGLEHADCPVDSVILERLDKKSELTGFRKEKLDGKQFSDYKWSKFNVDDEYKIVQSAISEVVNDTGKSNLYFDFTEWNKK